MNTRHLVLVAALAALILPGCRRPHVQTTPPPPAPTGTQRAASVSEPSLRLWTNGTADVAVIMYHDVVPRKEVWFDLTVREFEEQMRSLAEADATVVPLADVVAHLRDGKPLPPRAIALTFDDGTMGDYTHAFPVLRRYNFPATFFVHTDYVGVKSSKDHMSWDQLRELKRTGLIDIQPHTASHPEDLTKMTDEAVRLELEKSNAVFEREMGEKARFLAYPSGHGDERVAKLVEAAGYEAAWNEVRAWNASPADRFHLPRFAPFRLYEVLEAWRLERDAAPTPAWTVMRLASAGRDTAAAVTPDALAEFEVGRQAFASDGEALLGGDGYTPMPDARQHDAIGRPIVVQSADQTAFARYQPWMGVEEPALNVLLPGALRAVVGRDWLVHEGQALPIARRRVRRSAIFGVLDDGRPFAARAGGRATVESLGAALIRLGAREAVLL